MPEQGGTEHADPLGQRFDLAELTQAADVSVRTVRYYIAEGLLPPPAGGGPRSHYTASHLDRLRLIARLKAAYLPLREIRRRLAGLDDVEVRRVLAAGSVAGHPDPALDDAAAYLDHVLGAPPSRSASRAQRPPAFPVADPTAADAVQPGAAAAEPWGPRGDAPSADTPPAAGSGWVVAASSDDLGPAPGQPAPPPMLGHADPIAFPIHEAPAAEVPTPVPESWRRVLLGDDAELLIRASAYERRRDRIDWFVAWARKVFS